MATLTTFEERWTAALQCPTDFDICDCAVDSRPLQPLSQQGRLLCHAEKIPRRRLDKNVGLPLDPGVEFLDLGEDDTFFHLEKPSRLMFIRSFFSDLYDELLQCWSNKNKLRVILKGNEGTGKSWFQIYVLWELMRGYRAAPPTHTYLFVVRQVGKKTFDLIDLATGDVRRLKSTDIIGALDSLSKARVLYFFEPANDQELPPLVCALPALSTLSPYEKRIHQYKKCTSVIRLFPCLTFVELVHIAVLDDGIGLPISKVAENFHRFGGIARHVLATEAMEPSKYEEDQEKRLLFAKPEVLRSLAADVDYSKQEPDVSGYLLCYSQIPLVGQERFKKFSLEFTSAFVEQAIRKKMSTYSLREHFELVLGQLRAETKDRSGMHLQETVTYLLSIGSNVAWKEVKLDETSHRPWSAYRTQRRTIKKLDDITEGLRTDMQLLVSTDPSFPIADSVFSQSQSDGNIDSTQVSWQDSRPFTLLDLFRFRRHYLQVPDATVVRVSYVVPRNETKYLRLKKSDFLSGDITTAALKYSDTETVPVQELQTMWENTHIYVIQPAEDWDALLMRVLKEI